jgi:hypothetical protein
MFSALFVCIHGFMHTYMHTRTELVHILHSYRKLATAEVKVATAGREVAQAELSVLEATVTSCRGEKVRLCSGSIDVPVLYVSAYMHTGHMHEYVHVMMLTYLHAHT